MKERIRQLRKHLGLNQTEFGSRLGVSDGAVSQWEQGKQPHASRIALICKEFNVNKDWLMSGVGEMFNAPAVESGAEITIRHIVELFEKMPPGLQDEFLKIVQEVVDKIKRERGDPEIKKNVSDR